MSPAVTTAVIQSWHTRFGARLLSLGTATLAVAVAWPPSAFENARHIVAEYLEFCNDLAQLVDLEEYARTLVKADSQIGAHRGPSSGYGQPAVQGDRGVTRAVAGYAGERPGTGGSRNRCRKKCIEAVAKVA